MATLRMPAPPGPLIDPGAVRVVVIATALLQVGLVIVTLGLSRILIGHHHTALTLALVATLVLVAAVVAALTGRFAEVSAWARAAVALAAVQATLAVGALLLWQRVAGAWPTIVARYPLATEVPAVALGASALVVAAAALGARTTATPRWLVAAMALAIGFVLATALWLPLYAQWGDYGAVRLARVDVAGLHRLLGPVLGPPAGVAALAALVVAWRPRWARWLRAPTAVATVVLLVVAMWTRRGLADELTREGHFYEQFVVVLVGAGWFATMTVVALAVAQVRGARRAARLARGPGRLCGTVVADPAASAVVVTLTGRGALAGPVPHSRGFTLRTAQGDFAVPSGLDVIAPIPTVSAPAIAVACAGDEVEVSGFVTPAADVDGPFRAAARPFLGTRGAAVIVARGPDQPIARDVLMRVWPPCVLLLAATVLAALPGLAGIWFG